MAWTVVAVPKNRVALVARQTGCLSLQATWADFLVEPRADVQAVRLEVFELRGGVWVARLEVLAQPVPSVQHLEAEMVAWQEDGLVRQTMSLSLSSDEQINTGT
jgi:hypothetical protein